MRMLLVSFLFLSACGTESVIPEEDLLLASDHARYEEVMEYYQDFLRECSVRRDPWCFFYQPQLRHIRFADAGVLGRIKDGQIVGTCSSYSRDGGSSIFGTTVRIDRGFWNDREPIAKKALVFHEMHHCLRRVGHAPEGAVSIMAPTMAKATEDNWNALVDESFARNYNTPPGQ